MNAPAGQQAVRAALDDRERVSTEQAAFAQAPGDVFLRACPGSGKTRCIGLRLARSVAFHRERSIAAVSHTNTAEQAIRSAAQELVTLPTDYFVGTLHAFLLTYVVYPFGHLYMKCPEPRVVVADDRDWPTDLDDTSIGEWTRCRIKAWAFEVDAERHLSYRRPATWPSALTEERIVQAKTEWAKKQKQAYWERGLLSFADVLYVAMRVLEAREDVRCAVAARFDELIVDEAQDTNDLQLRCLALLRSTQLRPSLVLVGDVDQAIYEWGRAWPEALLDQAAQQQLSDMRLSANYRSSTAICKITHRFSSRPAPDDAKGRDATCALSPEVWALDAEPAVARFRDHIARHEISETDSAVLVRTNAQVNTLNDASAAEPWHWLLGILGRAAFLRDTGGPTRDVFDSLHRAVGTVAYKATHPRGLDHDQREGMHDAVCQLLEALPSASGDLRRYNLTARDCLRDAAKRAVDGARPATNAASLLKDDAALERYDAQKVFQPAPPALARTIHDVKGASIDAVLLIARPEDLGVWLAETQLTDRPEVCAEDTRLAYVALSRARRILILASPAPHAREVDALRSLGFATADADA